MPQYLFSYGSNDPEQLERRLDRPVQTLPAFAEGWVRVFRGSSRTWGGAGVASLRRRMGGVTYGLAIPVDPEDLAVLDRYEGVPRAYKRKTIPVVIDGDPERAVAYIATSTRFNAPSEEYLEAVARTISTHWRGSDGSPVEPRDITLRNPRTVGPLEIFGDDETPYYDDDKDRCENLQSWSMLTEDGADVDLSNLLQYMKYWSESHDDWPGQLMHRLKRSLENPVDYGLDGATVAFALRQFDWLDEEEALAQFGAGWAAPYEDIGAPNVDRPPPAEEPPDDHYEANLLEPERGGGEPHVDLSMERRPCDVMVEPITAKGSDWLKAQELKWDDTYELYLVGIDDSEFLLMAAADEGLNAKLMGPIDWIEHMQRQADDDEEDDDE